MNLVKMLQDQLGDVLANQASSFLGESSSNTSKALGAVLPSIMGAMMGKASDTNGAGALLDMIKGGGFESNDMLSNIGGLLGGGNTTDGLLSSGGSILSSLLGGDSKMGTIANVISNFSGLKQGSSSSLLKMAAPLVMSFIGKQVKSRGLGASGLMGMLLGQKDNIKNAIPSGISGQMGDLMGFANVGNTPTVEATSGGGSKWLWPLLLAAGVAAAFYFMKGCDTTAVTDKMENATDVVGNAASGAADAVGDAASGAVDAAGNAVDAAGDAASNAADAVGDAASGAVDAAGNALSKLGAFFSRKLSTGVELNIPENGIENNLIKFVEGDAAVDKTTWFNFDRLTFASGSSNLDMEKSAEQLNNMYEILRAFPKVNLKLGGYTDNTGSEAANMKISQRRADAVKAVLVKKGISADRLEAEGFGPAHPVASNDTEEGRAQNRRIAARVTAK
jgi:outer membrane protein OmpA-like peptidoglycan-associated protein